MANLKKSYKDYPKIDIGSSDIAALIVVGCGEHGLHLSTLNFTEDGDYQAYLVPKGTIIGPHYRKVATFYNWIKIYDDDFLTFKIKAKEVNIFRAGDYDCIIEYEN